jgi:anti-sigma B factor antagonist
VRTKGEVMKNYGPRIEVSQDEGVSMVYLLDVEILEEYVINEIKEALFAVVDDSMPVKMVLSFACVTHLSSSTLGMLILLRKKIVEFKGAIKLCDIKPNLYEIFVLTKLNKLFEICDSEEAALKAFRK